MKLNSIKRPISRAEMQMIVDYINEMPPFKKRYKKHITVRGYWYSGSSAVIDFLREFSNTTVYGLQDNVYCKEKGESSTKEITFFSHTNFLSFIKSFEETSDLIKDIEIKKFINSIYNCYDKKSASWEKNPELYNDEFLEISLNFLYNVLELDEYTIQFMEGKRFPLRWNSADETFNKCCFMKEKGIKQYLFYKFKNITRQEFDIFVRKFIKDFWGILNSKEIFVSDQAFNKKSLEQINYYLDNNPIKEIVVYRDPRDQFLSNFRINSTILNIKNIILNGKNELNEIKKYLQSPDEHSLFIRFEDLVLKYDETTQKIMDFCGIDPANHVRPKAIFDPAISVVNIGAYKSFIDQGFMRQIEEELGKICYYPEKENLSEEAWNLLKSVQ